MSPTPKKVAAVRATPTPAPVIPSPVAEEPSITPTLLLSVLAFVVTQAVALGAFGSSTGRTVLQIGGIVIPAVFALVSSLHITLVHAARIKAGVAR